MEFDIRQNSWIAKLAAKKLQSDSVALVLGPPLPLFPVSKEDFLKDDKWVKHEICHINQFKKYGFYTFIIKYLYESIKNGYDNNKYEVEARNAENE